MELDNEETNAGQVATRSRETGNQPGCDGIVSARENNRYGRGRRFRGARCKIATACCNNTNIAAGKRRSQAR